MVFRPTPCRGGRAEWYKRCKAVRGACCQRCRSCWRGKRLEQFLKTVLGVILRVGLLLAGLVVLASLLVAVSLLLALWLLRAAWAKLTGRPVQPWVFKVNRQAMWDRFYRGTRQSATGQPPGTGWPARGNNSVVDADVTDVEVKAIKSPEA